MTPIMIKIANNLLPLLTKTSADDFVSPPAPNFAQRMAGGINKGLTGLTNAYNQGTQAIQQDPTIPNMVQGANKGVQDATNFVQDHLAQRSIPNFVESVTNEVPSVINNFEGAAGAYGNNLLARGKAIGSGIAGLSGAANQGLANATNLVDPAADQVDSAIAAARPTFEQARTQLEGAANQLGQQYEAAGQGVQGAMNLASKGLDAGATGLRDRLRARYPGLMGGNNARRTHEQNAADFMEAFSKDPHSRGESDADTARDWYGRHGLPGQTLENQSIAERLGLPQGIKR